MSTDSEHSAWLWLMNLQRIAIPDNASALFWREKCDRQIKINACPGKLHETSGAPLVRISAWIPGLKKRVSGSGNSLYVACERLQSNAWREGVELPFVSIFHMERQRAAQP